ncbi:hypothetical protein F5144DRAFT_552565 [Chaetomium tenue]|uniref:Uncharacterized protein n=1 Tax=Chaetomium tenue TaxID=1854479 RepID=A0ACB7PKA6_9PEZI|nr:hypothetical protein F5144DRAFT_552565 [Chaetomium globosum]
MWVYSLRACKRPPRSRPPEIAGPSPQFILPVSRKTYLIPAWLLSPPGPSIIDIEQLRYATMAPDEAPKEEPQTGDGNPIKPPDDSNFDQPRAPNRLGLENKPELGSSSLLENLPAELRDQILLSVPDLLTLQSLVRASPLMHAQYRSNRDAIIRACVARDLDGLVVDAYACVMSRVHVMGRPRTKEKIIAFLGAYHGWISDSRIDVSSIRSSYVRWLSAFHLDIVKPLARRYSTWALQHLFRATCESAAQGQGTMEPPVAEAQEQDVSLSRSEEIRIFRALYRYETYYHLFGRRNQEGEEGIVTLEEINSHFFGLFHPWEAEAIGCIDIFVRQRYDWIFDEVQDDLHAVNPEINFRDDTQVYEGLALACTQREDFMDGTVSRGLRVTVYLFATDDHKTLLAKLRKCLRRSRLLDDPVRRTFMGTAQSSRRDTALNARDEAEQRKEVMEFTGDAVPPDGPPLGWGALMERDLRQHLRRTRPSCGSKMGLRYVG